MKKLVVIFAMLLFSITAYSQYSAAYVHGGYSPINGVFGVEYKMNQFGLSGGIIPEGGIGLGASLYRTGIDEAGIGYYLTAGFASRTIGSDHDDPYFGAIIGIKIDLDVLYLKAGPGINFNGSVDDYTVFEITFGLRLTY